MEQHPVPQNVTTFQFRLIGDMTIKQFGYLAGGLILAYISYKLPLPFFFTWPLTTIFALGGVGFAFVPIEDRPMDVWALSFIKNIYNPTLYVWEKSVEKKAAPPLQNPVFTEARASQYLAPTHQTIPVAQKIPTLVTQQAQPTQQSRTSVAPQSAPQKTTTSVITNMYAPRQQTTLPQTQPIQRGFSQPAPAKKLGLFDWFFSLFAIKGPQPTIAPRIAPATPSQAPVVKTPSIVGTRLDLSMPPVVKPPDPERQKIQEVVKREEILEEKLSTLTHELENKSIAESRILELQKQLTEVLEQKDQMGREMAKLQQQIQATSTRQAAAPIQQITTQAPIPPLPPIAKPEVPKPTIPLQSQKQPTVKIITPEGAVTAGLPRLTTFPNVVTGITKDSDNNFLPGVLVTVKDKEGIPVRALKTNRLGQFAASTPLSNGVYFVEIEDPRQRYTFDRVQVTLNGSIVPALEIITKSQKQITRDQLTKELFGNRT